MPIYEFHCENCNTLFNFFSQRVNTTARPPCPRCKDAILSRRMSVFSLSRGGGEEAEAGIEDPGRMEKAMEALGREAGRINPDDPRQSAAFMRQFMEGAGLPVGEGMAEALSRLESGQDPEAVEAELGSLLENEDPFAGPGAGRKPGGRGPFAAPRVDPRLYDLEEE
ncbi:MAG: zinc ribbon domain-containing protein [Proteobacteria bacterium]|nr:zinc ribbon domain-containing protein [Pseudomonadota bacterium]